MPNFDDPEKPHGHAISPKLAGDRAAIEKIINGIKDFVTKYEVFSDFKGKKILATLDKLADMPSSKVFLLSKTINEWVWNVSKNMRDAIRKSVAQELSGQLRTNKASDMQQHPAYQAKLAAMSKEFNNDQQLVIGYINKLASAAGELKRSGGFGGKADKAFLDKKIKGYVDDQGVFHKKGGETIHKPSDVSLKGTKWQPTEEVPDEPSSVRKREDFKNRASAKKHGPVGVDDLPWRVKKGEVPTTSSTSQLPSATSAPEKELDKELDDILNAWERGERPRAPSPKLPPEAPRGQQVAKPAPLKVDKPAKPGANPGVTVRKKPQAAPEAVWSDDDELMKWLDSQSKFEELPSDEETTDDVFSDPFGTGKKESIDRLIEWAEHVIGNVV